MNCAAVKLPNSCMPDYRQGRKSLSNFNLRIVPGSIKDRTEDRTRMNIFKNTVVTLKYSLFDADGKLIEESKDPITYLHGGYDNILPKVEEALASKSVGEEVSVTMEPEDAFGEYDESLIRVEDSGKFPPNIKVGDQFEG